MSKINQAYLSFLTIILVAVVVFSRFVGLSWGLPYHMHPDERNMVIAIQNMNCLNEPLPDCFDPEFYAYGQFPLFLGFLISKIITFFRQSDINSYLLFEDVAIALRLLSAVSSILTVVMILKIISLIIVLSKLKQVFYLPLIGFVPIFIQSAHFGTTEALLQLFIVVIIWLSIALLKSKISLSKYIVLSGICLGLSFSTKVSSALYAIIPLLTLFLKRFEKNAQYELSQLFLALTRIAAISAIIFFITSPFNILSWEPFIHSLNYESSVGLGDYKAFYTRQFEYTMDFIFQFVRVLPFALGVPHFVLAIFGFIFLPYSRAYILLRIVLLIIFIPHAMMYAKWTRFIAPTYPIFVIFSILFINLITDLFMRVVQKIKAKLNLNFLHRLSLIVFLVLPTTFIYFAIIAPGVAYIAVYATPDVRFVASKWMYENIESQKIILSETANVVDVPMPNDLVSMETMSSKVINPVSFNFYELHHMPGLIEDLQKLKETADYIFVPSRRIFYNHTCYVFNNGKPVIKKYSFFDGYDESRCEYLKEAYPELNSYYKYLFESGDFEMVAEFTSFPRIVLWGNSILSFNDEDSEETFTVFDHPVIRVYKRK
jgi:hypothetical protein